MKVLSVVGFRHSLCDIDTIFWNHFIVRLTIKIPIEAFWSTYVSVRHCLANFSIIFFSFVHKCMCRCIFTSWQYGITISKKKEMFESDSPKYLTKVVRRQVGYLFLESLKRDAKFMEWKTKALDSSSEFCFMFLRTSNRPFIYTLLCLLYYNSMLNILIV